MATDGERSHRRHGQLDGESEVAVNGESREPAARLAHSRFGNTSHERGLPSFAASKPLIRRLQRQTQDRNLK